MSNDINSNQSTAVERTESENVAVAVHNVTKKYGRNMVLDGVSFDIPKNCTFGLIGPNGAGKTTLFSIIAGFVKATNGEVNVLGINVENISALMGRFSMLPQDAAFQSGIPVLKQLVMFGELNGMTKSEAREAALEALRIVGLAEVAEKSASSLSHGMSKRVALCQAFIGDPEVIILDEPTAGLDPDNARNVRDLIRNYAKDKTVIISSHNLKEIENICDHVAILNQGKLVESSKMDRLVAADSMIRIEIGEDIPEGMQDALLAENCVKEFVSIEGQAFTLSTASSSRKETLKALYGVMAGYDIYPTSVREGDSLESRFLHVTGGESDGSSST